MNNIRSLISSSGWAEVKKETEKRIAEVEIEILTEANKPSPDIAKLQKKSSMLTAYRELLLMPSEMLEEIVEQREED